MIAVIALLVGLLLPALAASREAGRAAVCLSNLRQAGIACQLYANENDGKSPAVGQPYLTWPNWALVVQTYAGRKGQTPGELYSARSVLVCPTIAGAYGQNEMVRTYAMNATGHAGLSGDPDDYDDEARPAFLRMDRVRSASTTPLLLDSAVPPATTSNPPPPTRTAAMIDFRQDEQVRTRLGRFHKRTFHAVMFDLSASAQRDVAPAWSRPLP